jgi:hypothetical protein
MANIDSKRVISDLAKAKLDNDESKMRAAQLIKGILFGDDDRSKNFSKMMMEAIEKIAFNDMEVHKEIAPSGAQLNETQAIKGKLIEIADNLLM